jgi:hypothetical protein
MSYLYLPKVEISLGNAISMSKATVSFWFRFSQDTIDRVLANPPPRGGATG